jgi:hypothetical protein
VITAPGYPSFLSELDMTAQQLPEAADLKLNKWYQGMWKECQFPELPTSIGQNF